MFTHNVNTISQNYVGKFLEGIFIYIIFACYNDYNSAHTTTNRPYIYLKFIFLTLIDF